MSRLRFLVPGILILVFTLFACGAATEPDEEAAGVAGTAAGAVAASGVAIFPDELIEEKIRLKMRQPEGPILTSDLEQVTSLSMALDLYVTDLSGLELLVNLTEFDLTQNKTIDISPLASITSLTRLNLTQNDIIDISALAPLTNLTFLWIQDNDVIDISALASLTNLTELNLQKNQIVDISALATLTNLTTLNLTSNNISDLSPLASLTNLTLIEFSKNEITDLSPLLDIGLGEGATIRLWGEPLDTNSVEVVIPQLKAAGVKVQF